MSWGVSTRPAFECVTEQQQFESYGIQTSTEVKGGHSEKLKLYIYTVKQTDNKPYPEFINAQGLGGHASRAGPHAA